MVAFDERHERAYSSAQGFFRRFIEAGYGPAHSAQLATAAATVYLADIVDDWRFGHDPDTDCTLGAHLESLREELEKTRKGLAVD